MLFDVELSQLFMIFKKLFKEHHGESQLAYSVCSDCCLLTCHLSPVVVGLLFFKYGQELPVQVVEMSSSSNT